jgi:hypothetical protein
VPITKPYGERESACCPPTAFGEIKQ